MSNTHLGSERGIALMISIMAILVVGGLIVGVATAARLEHRQGQNTGELRQASAVAELGLNEAIADWHAGDWNAMNVMEADSFTGTAPQGAGSYEGSVQRLNAELFLVDVTGTSARGAARHRLGSFVKLRPLIIDIQASLTTRGPVERNGMGKINGTDQPPTGWPTCGPPEDQAGIRLPDVADVDPGSCPGCITGDPAIEGDPTISDDTFFEFGDLDWDGLVSLANKTGFTLLNPTVEPSLDFDGECDASDPENWGDPLNPTLPCGEYFPIIYAPGDLKLNSGVGQGILIVEGDLHVQSKFEFYGIVLVKGRLTTAGGGAGSIHFRGAVMAANVDLDDNEVAGNANIQYSSCVLHRAELAAATGAQLRSRGWLQLF